MLIGSIHTSRLSSMQFMLPAPFLSLIGNLGYLHMLKPVSLFLSAMSFS